MPSDGSIHPAMFPVSVAIENVSISGCVQQSIAHCFYSPVYLNKLVFLHLLFSYWYIVSYSNYLFTYSMTVFIYYLLYSYFTYDIFHLRFLGM